MLGSVNSSNEYSFTQLEDAISNSKISEAISNYIGKNSGAKKTSAKILSGQENENINQTDNKILQFEDKAKKDKIKEEVEEDEDILAKFKESNEPVNIFDDEKEGTAESLGIAYGSDLSTLTRSFKSLAASVGSNDDKVTKSQLISLLQNLSAQNIKKEEFKDEIAFVKNLIAKFDTISEGLGYITSFTGVNDIQDYKTVTKEQVTPPIDLRI